MTNREFIESVKPWTFIPLMEANPFYRSKRSFLGSKEKWANAWMEILVAASEVLEEEK